MSAGVLKFDYVTNFDDNAKEFVGPADARCQMLATAIGFSSNDLFVNTRPVAKDTLLQTAISSDTTASSSPVEISGSLADALH